jgi:hypothetical protein
MMPRCFVVMGFGEKNDLATGRKLNLDATYRNIIKPTAEEAGYSCVRADEILHSGTIDRPMYDMLYDAELVIADLSTANLNAMFELGIRHALKPRSTIIIAEKQFTSPFDVNHVVIRRYEHLGTDIGFSETMRMRRDLKELILTIAKNDEPDSPLYTFMKLMPPKRIEDHGVHDTAVAAPGDSYAAQLNKAFAAKAASDFASAEAILREIYVAQTSTDGSDTVKNARPRVIQELALATYKAGEKRAVQEGAQAALDAYASALDLLAQLDPDHTTDPETLGLWAAVHKRLAENESRSDVERSLDLDTAIKASERGFLIRQDYYTGINHAYLLDYRASRSSGDDRITDRVLANRVRHKVGDIARAQIALIEAKLQTPGNDAYRDELYWTHASLAEALIALDDPTGPVELERAKRQARAAWMTDATLKQIERIKELRR